MTLERTLAHAFVATHPEDAAGELESLSPSILAEVLAQLRDEEAVRVVRVLAPPVCAATMAAMPANRAAALLGPVPPRLSAPILRRLSEPQRQAILDSMEARAGKALRSMLQYPDGTAGAIMDPRVLAFPDDMTAAETLAAVQRDADFAIYYLYVIDRDQVLRGVLNLQELMAARPEDRLGHIAKSARFRLPVTAGHRVILEHPGWEDVTSLPVVDAEEHFLGAVRYGALRALAASDGALAPGQESITVRALGDLFRTGIESVVDTLAGRTPEPGRGGVER